MTFTLRAYQSSDRDDCAEILASLPEWFGLADANGAYIEGLDPAMAHVVHDGDHRVVAFVGLHEHNPGAWEIEVMGVRREHHGVGIGRRLVAESIRHATACGARWLHVKTRGPSTHDDDYERTRRFYVAVGFEPLYESLTEWGKDDAALVLVMTLADA